MIFAYCESGWPTIFDCVTVRNIEDNRFLLTSQKIQKNCIKPNGIRWNSMIVFKKGEGNKMKRSRTKRTEMSILEKWNGTE